MSRKAEEGNGQDEKLVNIPKDKDEQITISTQERDRSFTDCQIFIIIATTNLCSNLYFMHIGDCHMLYKTAAYVDRTLDCKQVRRDLC